MVKAEIERYKEDKGMFTDGTQSKEQPLIVSFRSVLWTSWVKLQGKRKH